MQGFYVDMEKKEIRFDVEYDEGIKNAQAGDKYTISKL